MNIKEAAEQIEGAVRAYLSKDEHGLYRIPFRMQRPVIMLGPPGVGKTAVVEQIAEEMDINFVSYSITHHTRQSALGLPFIARENFGGQEYSVSEYTMSEIIASVHRSRQESGVDEGILFLDEVNCVSETLAPAMLQFLQYKTFGMHRLPEGWVIVTAGNPPEYNRAAREFDPAMLDRLLKIDVEPDVNVWQEYATSHGVHPAVTTYLDAKPGNFYKVRAGARGSKIVTSRGWEDLSRMLQAYEAEGLKTPADLPLRYLQDQEIAEDFAAYYDLFRKYRDDYKVVDILGGTVTDAIVRRAASAAFDERIAVVGLLLDAVRERCHQAVELAEACKWAASDLKKQKAGLDAAPDPAAYLRNFVEREERGSDVGKRGAKRAGDQAVVKAERMAILKEAVRAVAGDAEGGKKPSALAQAVVVGRTKKAAELMKRASASMDNVFLFLDEAFGDESQEALMFITKLSADLAVVTLVIEVGSAQYMKHNKSLLFTERKVGLLAEIEGLGV